nr:hypothetical protein [Tanacetum cinerariifolium]
MSSLFADTHNLVAILEKSDAAEGFEQIIDFLSGSYIHYALIVNPPIYISCIKQFWNTVSVKCSADVTRLQALVDKKKIVISEVFANMRRVGKGFSGVETPLFVGMLVAREVAEEGLAEEQVQVDSAVAAAVKENVVETVAEDGKDFQAYFQQVLDTCSALTRRVEHLEHDNVAQKLEIVKLKARVKRLEKANQVKSSKLKRLRKVGTSQRIEYSDDMEDEEDQEIIKSINETPAQKAAKRRKLNEEAQEAEELKRQLEIVNDEDDDVFTESTPLGRKVPVVDYQIVMLNNKPRLTVTPYNRCCLIRNQRIPPLPPWSGHPKAFIGQSEVSTFQDQVTGEEKLKATFKEFKQYEDNQVEKRCAEIDACLDALSIDFDEELYPHMLTVIVGRRWVIGHGLRLAVMKYDELTELR